MVCAGGLVYDKAVFGFFDMIGVLLIVVLGVDGIRSLFDKAFADVEAVAKGVHQRIRPFVEGARRGAAARNEDADEPRGGPARKGDAPRGGGSAGDGPGADGGVPGRNVLLSGPRFRALKVFRSPEYVPC